MTDWNDLTGKAALVTGGSRGVGAATSRLLAQHGADVALTYHQSGEQAQAVVDEITTSDRRALAIAANAADPQAVSAAVEQTAATFGRLDILVNNAAVFAYRAIDEATLADYETTMAINVRAVFVATRAAVAHLGPGGRIINIGSSIASKVPMAGVSLYAMSKQALVGFTKALAHDLGPRGITVNLIHPGPTDTDSNPAIAAGADHQRNLTTLGHFGAAEDIAATVVHLAAESGRYITGTCIAVDGGWAA